MKTTNTIILSAALALGLAGAALTAFAATDAGSEGWGRGHHTCQHDMGRRVDMMTAYLETRLGLTDTQRPAWDEAVAAVEQAVAAREAACEAMQEAGPPATALEALDRAESRMAAGLEQVREVRAAVADLYEALDDEQKATFDEMIAEFRHMRG